MALSIRGLLNVIAEMTSRGLRARTGASCGLAVDFSIAVPGLGLLAVTMRPAWRLFDAVPGLGLLVATVHLATFRSQLRWLRHARYWVISDARPLRDVFPRSCWTRLPMRSYAGYDFRCCVEDFRAAPKSPRLSQSSQLGSVGETMAKVARSPADLPGATWDVFVLEPRKDLHSY